MGSSWPRTTTQRNPDSFVRERPALSSLPDSDAIPQHATVAVMPDLRGTKAYRAPTAAGVVTGRPGAPACSVCGAPMGLIGVLPRVCAHPRVYVFGCRRCRRV